MANMYNRYIIRAPGPGAEQLGSFLLKAIWLLGDPVGEQAWPDAVSLDSGTVLPTGDFTGGTYVAYQGYYEGGIQEIGVAGLICGRYVSTLQEVGADARVRVLNIDEVEGVTVCWLGDQRIDPGDVEWLRQVVVWGTAFEFCRAYPDPEDGLCADYFVSGSLLASYLSEEAGMRGT